MQSARGMQFGTVHFIAANKIQAHTHLDKGHIWPRAANPDGTFAGALESVAADRLANWSARDVAARMEFFKDRLPTSTIVEVNHLADPGLLIEFQAMAAL